MMKFAVIAAIVSFNLTEAVKIEQKDWYSGPWEQQWSNEWRDQREQDKEAEQKKEEDEKMAQLHGDQRSRYDYIMGWYDPVEHPNEYSLGSSSIEAGEQKEQVDDGKKKKKKQEDDPWKLMMSDCEDCGYDGKKFKAEDMYAAGRSHSGYLGSSSDVPLWNEKNGGYKDDWKQMERKMKESGEEWGPREWFDAGKQWVAPVEESTTNESQSQNNNNNNDQSSSQDSQPVVTPDYLLGGSDLNQYYDEPKHQKGRRQQQYDPYGYQPIKVQDDPMLGYHYDEYDLWEDEYARPQDKYWSDEKPEGYQPSAWEQRDQYRQAYNDYGRTMPQWNEYIPEETQQQISDYRDSYDGKKAWYKSKDFNVDLEPMRESWGNAVYDWQQDAPTWDSWSSEQGW